MSEFVEKYINPEDEYYRDLKNSLDTAREEGEAEGIIKGKIEGKLEEKIEIARKMLAMEMPIDTIIQLTGLSEEQIKSLK